MVTLNADCQSQYAFVLFSFVQNKDTGEYQIDKKRCGRQKYFNQPPPSKDVRQDDMIPAPCSLKKTV